MPTKTLVLINDFIDLINELLTYSEPMFILIEYPMDWYPDETIP